MKILLILLVGIVSCTTPKLTKNHFDYDNIIVNTRDSIYMIHINHYRLHDSNIKLDTLILNSSFCDSIRIKDSIPHWYMLPRFRIIINEDEFQKI